MTPCKTGVFPSLTAPALREAAGLQADLPLTARQERRLRDYLASINRDVRGRMRIDVSAFVLFLALRGLDLASASPDNLHTFVGQHTSLRQLGPGRADVALFNIRSLYGVLDLPVPWSTKLDDLHTRLARAQRAQRTISNGLADGDGTMMTLDALFPPDARTDRDLLEEAVLRVAVATRARPDELSDLPSTALESGIDGLQIVFPWTKDSKDGRIVKLGDEALPALARYFARVGRALPDSPGWERSVRLDESGTDGRFAVPLDHCEPNGDRVAVRYLFEGITAQGKLRSSRPDEKPTKLHRRFVERMIRRRIDAWALGQGLDAKKALALARTYGGKAPRRGGAQADVRSNRTTEERMARMGIRRKDTASLYAAGMDATTNPVFTYLLRRN